jgi:hypothetical protein
VSPKAFSQKKKVEKLTVCIGCEDFLARQTEKGTVYLCVLCMGKTTSNQHRHCCNDRHQILVRAEKDRVDCIASWRAKNQASGELASVVDEGINQLDVVVDQNRETCVDGFESDPDENELVPEPEIVPLDIFEEEESEIDDSNEDALWMSFINNAVRQISSEPV